MVLSIKHVTEICQLDKSGECMYLEQDYLDLSKWHCLKKNKVKKADREKEVNKYIKQAKDDGHEPEIPLGDNCEGYLILHHIEQGFDKKQ